jgi:hypothetical protein
MLAPTSGVSGASLLKGRIFLDHDSGDLGGALVHHQMSAA